jgi:hypothetical protein
MQSKGLCQGRKAETGLASKLHKTTLTQTTVNREFLPEVLRKLQPAVVSLAFKSCRGF